jgi:hypothetical protein
MQCGVRSTISFGTMGLCMQEANSKANVCNIAKNTFGKYGTQRSTAVFPLLFFFVGIPLF